MSAITLYEIGQEHLALAHKLEDMELDPVTLADTLEGDLAVFEDKARAVACVMRNLEAEAEAYASHAKAIQAKAKSLQSRVEWLNGYLLANMRAVGVTEITGPAMKIKLANNPESVEIYDESQIPESFMQTPPPPDPVPDKAAIKDAIKSGFEVSGARLTRTKRVKIS